MKNENAINLETVLKPKNEQKVLKMVVIEVPNF